MKIYLTLISLLAVEAQAVNILTIDVRNRFISASNPISDDLNSPLMATDLIQLGYFDTSAPTTSGAVTFDNFVPLSDPNGDLATNLGLDSSGTFSGEAQLSDELNAPDASSLSLQFGLRFFNGTTEETSTFFNTVTNSAWTFAFVDEATSPPPLPSLIDISGFNQSSRDAVTSAVWQGTPFQTSVAVVAVPEPGTSITAFLGAALLLGARRRK